MLLNCIRMDVWRFIVVSGLIYSTVLARLFQEQVVAPLVVAHSRVQDGENSDPIATHSGSKHAAHRKLHKHFGYPHVGMTAEEYQVSDGNDTLQPLQTTRNYIMLEDNDIDNADTNAEYDSYSEEYFEEDVEETAEDHSKPNDEPVQSMEITFETETEKRKYRRHAQTLREKEAMRRLREGKPMNILHVDRITQKPYNDGISKWRAELMLLSRNLDPSIKNVNHQPKSKVNHIAEWIKHTWHYTNPINFKYVKEAIARGVCLRRSALWRKIELKEPKPDDVSDHTWRALTLELKSEITQKKALDCSRVNASRHNFGRTGPTGEVGVVNRLTSKFKRPPHPHEIRMEMAWDKGYGGISKRGKFVDRIMHGSGEPSALLLDAVHVQNQDGDVDLGVHKIGITPEVSDVSRFVVDPSHRGNKEPTFNGQGSGKGQSMAENQFVPMSVVLQRLERMRDFERALKSIAPAQETPIPEQAFCAQRERGPACNEVNTSVRRSEVPVIVCGDSRATEVNNGMVNAEIGQVPCRANYATPHASGRLNNTDVMEVMDAEQDREHIPLEPGSAESDSA